MTLTERWRPIPGLDLYEASDGGRIRSLRRGEPYTMKATPGPCAFNTISVVVSTRPRRRTLVVRVPVLVASAWIGPRPPGLRIRHVNGDPLDDRVENLAYGTSEEIRADEAARARRAEATGAPTHCPAGHPYADATWLGDYGRRVCRRCRYEAHAVVKDTAERVGWCVDCGVELPAKRGPGPLRLRCAEHAREAQREASRRYEQKRVKDNPERVGWCIDCGVQLPAQRGPGMLRQRCDQHALEARREAWRRHGRKRQAARATVSPKR